jgi:hypothetical protein
MEDEDWVRYRDPEREAPYRRTDVGSPLTRSYWTARGVVPRWQLLVVYLVVVAITVVGFIRIGHQASNAEDTARQTAQLTRATNKLARENAALTLAIQHQRTETIRSSCEDQNRRHDATIAKLDVVLRRAVPDPTTRLRIRTQNALLIDALAPHQDCATITQKAAPAPTPTPTPSPTP